MFKLTLQCRFQQCEPQTFRKGDIVQAQLSFVVIPLKGGRRKMLTVLRSLALLDRSFSQVSIQYNTYSIELRTDSNFFNR